MGQRITDTRYVPPANLGGGVLDIADTGHATHMVGFSAEVPYI